ncbi:MAG TPA: hypothetical protein VK617_04255 [Gemmatimonadaceae bacterium]|nr:hypothetical protein [Gemmatimonadaceae bacterium]
MNGMSVFLLARFIHVVAGVIWAGALIFIPWFVLPAIRATGPAGGTFMQQIVRVQKLPLYLMTLMALTILSGLSLFWLNVRASGEAWMHTGPGRTFSLGGALAILAALLGIVVNMPTAGKMSAISASVQASGAPPSAAQAAELARLQNRLNRAGQAAAVLVLLAVACMGVARYIP